MEPLSFCVDCRALTSRSAVHDELARVFSFPAHYGRNLDALYDCLTALPPAGSACCTPAACIRPSGLTPKSFSPPSATPHKTAARLYWMKPNYKQ